MARTFMPKRCTFLLLRDVVVSTGRRPHDECQCLLAMDLVTLKAVCHLKNSLEL